MVAVAVFCARRIPQWSHKRNAKFLARIVAHIMGTALIRLLNRPGIPVRHGHADGQPTSSPTLRAAISSSRALATRERMVSTLQPMTFAACA
jgi:hypothetical protein